MKEICRIYDISKEYEMKDNSVVIVVSDVERDKLLEVLPEIKIYAREIMTTDKWNEFLNINNIYVRNENKFKMREIRHSKSADIAYRSSNSYVEIEEIFDNMELRRQIRYALSFLGEQQQRRFLSYYYDKKTYREIAAEEGRSASTIHESVTAATRNFIKHFCEYSETGMK